MKWSEFVREVAGQRGRWVYRGGLEHWALETSLERTCKAWAIPFSKAHDLEHRLVREFRRHPEGRGLVGSSDDYLEWLALMQHHGAPTRLLDWTYSPYVAAFFAFESLLWHRSEFETRAKIWALDVDLLNEVKQLAADEVRATSRLVAALGELDARRLYLGEGCASLFTYCTHVLHLSEHAAYLRIEAARAARKWPSILRLLAEGALHLTAVGLVAPHLTAENHERVLTAARHRTKREIEELVASLRPLPAAPSSVRRLSVPKSGATIAAPVATGVQDSTHPPMGTSASDDKSAQPPREPRKPVAAIKPLAPERYRVQFTVSRETHDRLGEARDLLRHCVPDGDIAVIFDRALKLLLTELRKTRHAMVERPRATSSAVGMGRHVAACVKRAVWERDKGQCAFVGSAGRCSERGLLEYHHVIPYADGGATTAENLQLRCRAHNAYESERWFGLSEDDLAREARASYSAWTEFRSQLSWQSAWAST